MKDNKQQMKGRDDDEYRKGLWTVEEDEMLLDYVHLHGKGHWNRVSKNTGLKRSGKSCRLRWMNYLSPNVKRERFTEDEDDLIIRLHNLLGNRWALIAGRVPGRTDNQVKNYWNTHLSKKVISKKISKTPGYCSPGLVHDRKRKSCYSDQSHISAAQTEGLMISSDYSSNTTTCNTKAPVVTAATELSKEEESNKKESVVAASENSHQRDPQKAYEADVFGPIRKPAEVDDDHHHGSCFMQYLDDYTLNFVLNNSQKKNNVAAAL